MSNVKGTFTVTCFVDETERDKLLDVEQQLGDVVASFGEGEAELTNIESPIQEG